MQRINSEDMFYTGDEILGLWQRHYVSLDVNRKKEFLISAEISELVRLIKPVVRAAVTHSHLPPTSQIYRQGELVWIIEQPGESWSNFRKNSVLLAWQWIHGELPSMMQASFLKKEELDSIIHFRRSLVVEELNNHKKLSHLLLALQDSVVEKEYHWGSQVGEAEKLFFRLETMFEKEIGQKILPQSESNGSNQMLRHETVCNACGMILPIFNYHDC